MEGAVQERGGLGGGDVRRSCALDYCDRPPRSSRAELCEGHYGQRRRGKPFTPLGVRRFERPDCHVEGCAKPRKTGKWCTMHGARIRRHGDPHKVISNDERAVRAGESHPLWTESPTYSAWHQRLRKMKGSASQFSCSLGCGSQARHWAYIGPRALTERRPYETNPDIYAPLCVPCHKNFDLGNIDTPDLWKNRTKGGDWWPEAVRLYESGLGCTRIGRMMDKNPTSVFRALKKSGVEMRRRGTGAPDDPDA